MGSHLTEALVELGANVVAFVRATSSGALNNIGHLRSRISRQVRRPHRPHVGRLPRPRAEAGAGPAVRLPSRRPGPRRRVLAPAVRDGDGERRRHAQPPPVDPRPRARAGALRHRGHVGGVRQPARRRRRPARLRRRRRRRLPRALAAQPEVRVRNIEGGGGLPDDELLRRVRHPRRRDADVQQLRAAAEPALRHRHDHHAGAREAAHRARAARADARLLLLHGRRPRPSHGRRARHARRRLRLRPGREHLDARLGGAHPPRGRGGGPLAGRPRARERPRAPSPGRERGARAEGRLREARARDGLAAARLLGGRRPPDDRVVRGNRDKWTGRVDWTRRRRPAPVE